MEASAVMAALHTVGMHLLLCQDHHMQVQVQGAGAGATQQLLIRADCCQGGALLLHLLTHWQGLPAHMLLPPAAG